MTAFIGSMRYRRTLSTIPAALLLAGCAALSGPTPMPGDDAAAVLAALPAPTGEFANADGSRRLEFARGPFGRQTHMLDIDASGRIVRWEQVLTEAHFATIQPGISSEELRRKIGRPSWVWGVRYRDQTVWSYRFENIFCQAFHVGISPAGVVEDTSFGPDPRCERSRRAIH
jgi:hypothetical protein